jgi:hypothetical protein
MSTESNIPHGMTRLIHSSIVISNSAIELRSFMLDTAETLAGGRGEKGTDRNSLNQLPAFSQEHMRLPASLAAACAAVDEMLAGEGWDATLKDRCIEWTRERARARDASRQPLVRVREAQPALASWVYYGERHIYFPRGNNRPDYRLFRRRPGLSQAFLSSLPCLASTHSISPFSSHSSLPTHQLQQTRLNNSANALHPHSYPVSLHPGVQSREELGSEDTGVGLPSGVTYTFDYVGVTRHRLG